MKKLLSKLLITSFLFVTISLTTLASDELVITFVSPEAG